MSRPTRDAAMPVLWRALRENRWAVVTGAIGLCIYQAAEASVPVLLGVIIDRAMTSSSWLAPVISILVLGAVITTISLSWRTSYRMIQRANASHVKQLRSALTAKVVAPRDVESSLARKEYVTVVAEDTAQTSDIIEVVPVTISSAVGVIAGATVLAVIDPVLGGMVFAGTVVLLVTLNILSRRVTHRTEEQQRLIAVATGAVADLLRGLRPLTGFAGRAPAYRRYRALSASTRIHAERLARITGVYEGISAGIAALLVGVVGVVAGMRAFSGDISVGELVAVVGLTQFIAEPLGQLSRMPRFAALARGSARRVATLESARVPDGGAVVAPAGRRTDLSVCAEGTEVAGAELAGAEIDVAAGELVAIDCRVEWAEAIADTIAAGPDSAAGAPRVVVRGELATQLDAVALRRVVLADARHPAIFEGTLASALAPPASHYRGDHIPAIEDSMSLLAEVGLDELSDGPAPLLSYEVAERGVNLSGGQRQRLALARALLADPEVLVVVDPTSAVDAVTATRVAAAVRRRRHGKTTVILAASPAFVRIADRVVRLE